MGGERCIERGVSAAERREWFVQQVGERFAGEVTPGRQPVAGAPAVPQDGPGRGCNIVARLGENTDDPAAHLGFGCVLLGHLVFEVAAKTLGSVFEDGDHERLLRAEVTVEGLIGQARLSHDVADPRTRGGAITLHQRQGCVEQPAHLTGVRGAASRKGLGGDAIGDVVGFRNCVRKSQNSILPS